MERQEILQALAKWQEADKENRAILCIAVERNKAEREYYCSKGLAGTGENIIEMIKYALKNDRLLVHLIKKAFEELTIETTIKRLFPNADDKDTNNKNKEEEQK